MSLEKERMIMERLFTQETVPLLSRVTIDDAELSNPAKLGLCVRVNNALSVLPIFGDDEIEKGFLEFMTEELDTFKPLVIVGPSGVGKVTIYGLI